MSAPTRIDHDARTHSTRLAYGMVRAAALAYQDEATVAATARGLPPVPRRPAPAG
ncbi:hypothetical protein AB0F18_01240 [Streptomyces sp. NPDC029216]|uniref:hypothetical protein n=1 Tax=Streptomyces sp. NPDC029216 TaxID=3154701 RepID=UPI0033DE7A44